jgi:hypothetical protein
LEISFDDDVLLRELLESARKAAGMDGIVSRPDLNFWTVEDCGRETWMNFVFLMDLKEDLRNWDEILMNF